MSKNWILVVIALFIFLGCKRSFLKTYSTSKTFHVNNVSFDYLTSKTHLTITDPQKQQVEAIATIRMKKDSVVWINISPGLNIEALRILFTTDSVKIVNKIDKQYYLYTYEELSKKINVKLSLEIVQAILIGNTPFTSKSDSGKLVLKDAYFLLRQQYQSVLIDNYVGSSSSKLERLIIYEQDSTNKLFLNYSNFQLIDHIQVAPFLIAVSLQYKSPEQKINTTDIVLEYKKIELLKRNLRFPFTIPQRYERKY